MSERRISWLVTDGMLWRKLTEIRRGEIRAWLRMNGIDPCTVPVDGTVVVAEVDGVWLIRYEEFRTAEAGTGSGDDEGVYAHECRAPLTIDPPMHWLIPSLEQTA